MSKRALVTMVVVAVLLLGGAVAVVIGSRTNESADRSAADTTVSQPGNESAEHMDMPAQDSQNQGTGATESTIASAQATDKVSISDFAYAPKNITVKVGTTVTWTNNDSVGHNVVMEDGADGPSSEMLSKGQSYSYTFEKAGTYNYYCTPHPYMKGTVVVTE